MAINSMCKQNSSLSFKYYERPNAYGVVVCYFIKNLDNFDVILTTVILLLIQSVIEPGVF